MLTKDSLLNAALIASGGKQVVKYDDIGKPSVMVRIPKFNLEDINPDLGTGPHPAFIVNGIVKNEIYIGAYQAIVDEGRACSLPGVSPKVNISFDAAKEACTNKGPGWHLMTAWEWAAIAMWCFKNGFQPRGNTSQGKSHEAAYETGVPAPDNFEKILAGSGPVSWRHDNTVAGIADLVGNIWEWNDGMFIRDGRLYFPVDNNFTQSDTQWPASSIYLDSSTGPVGGNISVANGNVIINDRITKHTETPTPFGGGDNRDITFSENNGEAGWRNTAVAETFDTLAEAARKQAAQLLIAPKLTRNGSVLFSAAKGFFRVRNYGERRPFRGGDWHWGARAGLAALELLYRRSNVIIGIGLRPAFIL